jgi:hypothetical protein
MGESSIAAPAATGTTSTGELATDVPIHGFRDGPRFALSGGALRSEAASVRPLLGQSLNFQAVLCDRVIAIQAGRIVEQGPTAQVLFAPPAQYTRELLASIPHPSP